MNILTNPNIVTFTKKGNALGKSTLPGEKSVLFHSLAVIGLIRDIALFLCFL